MRACAPARAGVSSARGSCISASTGGPTPALPGTRSPRRCSPTACTSWAARSSITARAVCLHPAPRSPTRWWPCAATPRATRPTCAPPSSSCTRDSKRTVRTAGRALPSTSAPSTICSPRSSRPGFTTRPSCGHGARGNRSTSRAFAPPPASDALPPRQTPTGTPRATPTATCSSRVRAPPDSRPPRPPRRAARASCCAMSRTSSAARCLRTTRARPRPSTAAPPRSG